MVTINCLLYRRSWAKASLLSSNLTLVISKREKQIRNLRLENLSNLSKGLQTAKRFSNSKRVFKRRDCIESRAATTTNIFKRPSKVAVCFPTYRGNYRQGVRDSESCPLHLSIAAREARKLKDRSMIISLEEGWQAFSVKTWIGKGLEFAGPLASVATTQLCP